MDINKFDQATEDFLRYADSLLNAAKSDIPQARSILTAPSAPPDTPSRESAAELCLRSLAGHLDDLMHTHDRLQTALGMSPRYWVFSDALKLTATGWEELRRVLAEHVDPALD